ncbi:MAG: hypothetical protein PHU51_03355 [Candidatus Nanoarchaeia archaeon]|nr:hypothetical protein [Candidatus Nanoarchaeia archaeon]
MFERYTIYTALTDLVNSESEQKNNDYFMLLGKIVSEFDLEQPKAHFYHYLDEQITDYQNGELNMDYGSLRTELVSLGKQIYNNAKRIAKFYSLRLIPSKRDTNKARKKEYESLQDLIMN